MARNNKKGKSGNTFYREAITGGLQKEPYTLQKFGKHAFKAGKYATFGFLAVTAIWGCVDGFRIKTNPIVSRGMEVYMTNDDVLTSHYATAPETGYRIEGAEYNPFYYDEAGIISKTKGQFADTSEMYMHKYSKISVDEIRKNDWTKEEAIEEHRERAEDDSTPFADEIDTVNHAMGARILPFTVLNPYMSRAISLFNTDNDFETEQDWKDLTGNQNALKPFNYGTDDDGEKALIDAEYSGQGDLVYDYNYTTETFEQADIHVSLTELANPFNLLNTKGDPTRGYMGDRYGFTRRQFIDGGAIPNYMKQFTTSNASLVNTITTIDFTSPNNLLTTGNLNGLTKRLNPSKNYSDEEVDGKPPVQQPEQTLTRNDVTVDGGSNTHDMLNQSTWSQEEFERTGLNEEQAEDNEKHFGSAIFREDAVKAAMNTLSFVSGKNVTWNDTANADTINFSELLEIEGNESVDAVQVLRDWVSEGEMLKGDNLGNNFTNIEKYEVDVKSTLEIAFSSIVTANPTKDTYEGSGMTFADYFAGTNLTYGTSLFTTGHQPREGFQVTPSLATMRYGIENRGENWENFDSTDTPADKSWDDKMINGGYTMMDQNGYLVPLFDNSVNTDEADAFQAKMDAAKTDEEKNEVRENYIESAQDKGNMDAGLTATRMDDRYGDKSKGHLEEYDQSGTYSTYADYDVYTIGGKDDSIIRVPMEVIAPYVGMTSLQETGFYQGQVSPYSHTGTGEGVNASTVDAFNTEYNHDRIAMVSWGQAWGISPFYGAFVWPLSKVAIWVQSWMPPGMGIWGVILGIFLIVFALRGISTLFNWKGQKKQAKMQEIQFQVQKINAKYARYADNKAMKRRKQMEVMALYRKAGVNPMGSIGSVFTTMPVFLSIWTIINSIFVYKTAVMGGVSLAVSPLTGIFNMLGASFGVYIPIAAAVIAIQIISGKLPNWLSQKRAGVKNLDDNTKAAMKKSNRTSTIMTVVFVIMGLTVPALLGIYWMFSGLFTIGLNIAQHQLANRTNRRKNLMGDSYISLGDKMKLKAKGLLVRKA